MKIGVALRGAGREGIASIGALRAMNALSIPIEILLGLEGASLPVFLYANGLTDGPVSGKAEALCHLVAKPQKAWLSHWRALLLARTLKRYIGSIGREAPFAAYCPPGDCHEPAFLLQGGSLHGQEGLIRDYTSAYPLLRALVKRCQAGPCPCMDSPCSTWPLTAMGAEKTILIHFHSKAEFPIPSCCADLILPLPLPPGGEPHALLQAGFEGVLAHKEQLYDTLYF